MASIYYWSVLGGYVLIVVISVAKGHNPYPYSIVLSDIGGVRQCIHHVRILADSRPKLWPPRLSWNKVTHFC